MVLIFWLGFLLHYMLVRLRDYSGVIRITREQDKVVYSLELENDLEELEHVDTVTFRVENSDESFDRN
jgi:hypothetical protein